MFRSEQQLNVRWQLSLEVSIIGSLKHPRVCLRRLSQTVRAIHICIMHDKRRRRQPPHSPRSELHRSRREYCAWPRNVRFRGCLTAIGRGSHQQSHEDNDWGWSPKVRNSSEEPQVRAEFEVLDTPYGTFKIHDKHC